MPLDPNDLDLNIDTSPTLGDPSAILKVRLTDLANELRNTQMQAYIEANFGNSVLSLLQEAINIIPLI